MGLKQLDGDVVLTLADLLIRDEALLRELVRLWDRPIPAAGAPTWFCTISGGPAWSGLVTSQLPNGGLSKEMEDISGVRVRVS